ncbi:hypothetical protein SRHO_G00020100 [Serrasalmus rhombeus]
MFGQNPNLGPGVVIGQDGAVPFVRYGGTGIRVHHLRQRKVNTESADQALDQGLEQDSSLCGEERDQLRSKVSLVLIKLDHQKIRRLMFLEKRENLLQKVELCA